jgi:hypothetical protein
MTAMKLVAIALLALLVPAVAYSQDDPRVGVTMSSPGAFGVIWSVNDAVAIRPEITLSRTSGDSIGGDVTGAPSPVTTQDSTSVGVAVSGLFYLARKDALRPYVSPRFTYSRASASSTTDNGISSIVGSSVSESIVSQYAGSGSLGAQYSLGRRFSVFGELGASYARTTTTSTSTFTTTVTTIRNGVLTQTATPQTVVGSAHVNGVSTRAAVGVIVYF